MFDELLVMVVVKKKNKRCHTWSCRSICSLSLALSVCLARSVGLVQRRLTQRADAANKFALLANSCSADARMSRRSIVGTLRSLGHRQVAQRLEMQLQAMLPGSRYAWFSDVGSDAL